MSDKEQSSGSIDRNDGIFSTGIVDTEEGRLPQSGNNNLEDKDSSGDSLDLDGAGNGQLNIEAGEELSILAESVKMTPFLVHPYREESDEEARLCCSECGEYVEFVPGKNGAVCGCKELPKAWVMEETKVKEDEN